jgi:hypothetical protein
METPMIAAGLHGIDGLEAYDAAVTDRERSRGFERL